MTKTQTFWFFFLIAIVLIIPFFWGSYNSLVKREENVKKETASDTETAALSDTGSVLCWRGTLGDQIPILIQYQMSDELVVGSITYLSTSEEQPIKLLGTITEDNQFSFTEFDIFGNTTGHIIAQITKDELKGTWETFYSKKTHLISLSKVDTTIVLEDIEAIPEDLYGNYQYQYDEDGGYGSLSIEKAKDGQEFFEIHTTLGVLGNYHMADIEKDKVTLSENSFIYQLPGMEESKLRVRFLKGFAYVDYISGSGYGFFGMNADVHGFYIKSPVHPDYQYSHEKILKKMEYAVKKLNSDSNVFMNYHDIYFNDLDELTSQTVDTLSLSEKFVECYGKPVSEDFTRYQDDDSDWVKEVGYRLGGII